MRVQRVIDDHLAMNRVSRKDFAEAVGLSPSSASKWLSEQQDLSGQGMVKVMRWLFSNEATLPEETENTEEATDAQE